MLVELLDGGIKDIYTDTDSNRGCDTCDYGSSYINEFTIYLTEGDIQFKVSQMYEFALTEDYMMKTLLQNVEMIKAMTEKQFYDWLKEKLETDYKDSVDEFEIETTL